MTSVQTAQATAFVPQLQPELETRHHEGRKSQMVMVDGNLTTNAHAMARFGARKPLQLPATAHDFFPCLIDLISAGMISLARNSGQLRIGT